MKLKYNYEKQVKDLASEGDALVALPGQPIQIKPATATHMAQPR